MDRRDYTDRVLSSLRRVTEKEREAIRSELDGHIEDHMEALRELGYDEELAEERAIAAMGEPDEVGRELNKQYPFRWLVAKWGAILLAVWILVSVLVFSGEGRLGVWTGITERRVPNLRHHAGPSGGIIAAVYPKMEFTVGDDVVRIVRVCTYRSIPWGHLMAFVNFDSYDRRFMGVVGRKEMVLESRSGEKGEALIAGPFDWWNAGNGCVAIEPEDTYVTLRYDIYGESGSIQIPLPEGMAP